MDRARWYPIRVEGFDCGWRQLVIAPNDNLRPQLSHVLDQVVGEGVVVVEDSKTMMIPRFYAASRARSMARTTAHALLRTPSNSFSGPESATMPAPAWMWPCSPFMKRVRMAMQESKLPLKSA